MNDELEGLRLDVVLGRREAADKERGEDSGELHIDSLLGERTVRWRIEIAGNKDSSVILGNAVEKQ